MKWFTIASAALFVSTTSTAQTLKPMTAAEEKYQYPVFTKIIFLKLCDLANRSDDNTRMRWFEQFSESHSHRGDKLSNYIMKNSRHAALMRNPAVKAQLCETYRRNETKIRAELVREVDLIKASDAKH